jgi:SagB-type dehydrogenase family enzyme
MKDPIPRKKSIKYEPFLYPVSDKLRLKIPIERQEKNPFIDVFLSRKSSRQFTPLSITEISELLYYSSKIHLIETDGDVAISFRVTPSAGARHPVDILLSQPAPINERILSYYNPPEHSLFTLNLEQTAQNNFFEEIHDCININNATILWFSIQTTRTSSKYENAMSLYWRDTGAVLYCIQLISTYLGYNSCPIGTLATNSFNQILDSNKLVSGGGILVGGAP